MQRCINNLSGWTPLSESMESISIRIKMTRKKKIKNVSKMLKSKNYELKSMKMK